MNRQYFVAFSVIVALAQLGVACSAGSDANPDGVASTQQEAVTPGSGFEATFVGYNGGSPIVYYSGNGYTGPTNDWIADNTSPSIAAVNQSWVVAYQGTNGSLWFDTTVSGSPNNHDASRGMAPKTSPSVTGLPDGKYLAAFQSNQYSLWITGTGGDGPVGPGWGYGMQPGTNPSIAAMPDNSWVIAFQANTGKLWVVNSSGVELVRELELMDPNTSPSIAARADGSWQVAYQGSDNYLHTYSPSQGITKTGYDMRAGTNPSSATVPSGGYQTAFCDGAGHLYVVGPLPVNWWDQDWYGLAPNTSPSIAVYPDGAYEVAFQGYGSNHLWFMGTRVPAQDSLGAMRPSSSPSISPNFAAPTNVKVSATKAGSSVTANLSWSAVSGVTKYTVKMMDIAEKITLQDNLTSPNATFPNLLFSSDYSFAVSACYWNGVCAGVGWIPLKTPSNSGGGGTGGSGGGSNTASVGVWYYAELTSKLNCNTLSMTGTLTPGSFTPDKSGGAHTGSGNCPNIKDPTSMQCCSFYLGAGGLAAGNYTITTNVCNIGSFSLINGQNKQFIGHEACPAAIN